MKRNRFRNRVHLRGGAEGVASPANVLYLLMPGVLTNAHICRNPCGSGFVERVAP